MPLRINFLAELTNYFLIVLIFIKTGINVEYIYWVVLTNLFRNKYQFIKAFFSFAGDNVLVFISDLLRRFKLTSEGLINNISVTRGWSSQILTYLVSLLQLSISLFLDTIGDAWLIVELKEHCLFLDMT